jgi:hypothetical protein
MNIRRGLARIAHDQAEHLTTLAVLVQNGLERRRITRQVIFGIEFVSCSEEIRQNSTPRFKIKLALITNNLFCIIQRATAQSNTGIIRGYGFAEAPPVLQAGWSDYMCSKSSKVTNHQ